MPRFSRFLNATSNDKSRARRLYNANLRLGQAFYPLLNLFEISFRNTINSQLSNYFTDGDWIINQKTGFMSDSSLRRGKFYLRNQVNNAEQKIIGNGQIVTAGKIIAEQSFGFWTSFFSPAHYGLIGGDVIHCFRFKPTVANRSTISVKLNDIRGFRNRIYHNEPICLDGTGVSFTKVRTIKQDLMDLANWIDPDLMDYLSCYDSIESVIRKAQRI